MTEMSNDRTLVSKRRTLMTRHRTAYVIGGKKGDRPLAYAKHILTMGWKEQGGDGAAVQLPDDKNTIHFGSTAP